MWIHEASGDASIRTLNYSIPGHVFEHVDLIQPTTMFARMKGQRTSFHWSLSAQDAQPPASGTINLPNGINVNASCNSTVTVECLKELYNAIGVVASPSNGNEIGITAYLSQFANIKDLQLFYADQRPDALGSTFKFVSVNGEKRIKLYLYMR